MAAAASDAAASAPAAPQGSDPITLEKLSNAIRSNTVSLLTDSQYFDTNSSRFAELRKMLDSKSDKDKLDVSARAPRIATRRAAPSLLDDAWRCLRGVAALFSRGLACETRPSTRGT
jgi:hypothetical protein